MSGYLEVAGARVRYGELEVLKGVDLSVGKGEFVALLGSSGCGKTTLLRTIAGFHAPSQGSVRVEGRDVTRLPPDKRNMALVFQSYALWPHMTVDQNIGYGLKLRRMPSRDATARIAEMRSLLGLDALGRRKPGELSGGQRQRVALGRALAINPEILLLDEPLSNLDARIRLTVRHEISALQRRLGITAVHVTHDREEAMVMADRIVILNGGEVAQIGTPLEVYNQPNSDFVAAFMGAENVVDLEVASDGDDLLVEDGPHNRRAKLQRGRRTLTGGTAVARFRSEAISILDPAEARDDAGNGALQLEGTVGQVSYPGGLWRHVVHLGDGTVMVDAQRRFDAGVAVRLSIPDEQLYVFPRP